MAFYKDVKSKTRQEKRAAAIARGGFDDEGTGYRKGGQKGRGGEGRYQGGAQGAKNRPYEKDGKRRHEEARSAGYRDNAVRQAPRGERAPVDKSAPRFENKSGGYRFSSGAAGRYTGRGGNTAPRPYDEQRRARMQEERGYDRYRYDAPMAPAAPAQEESVPNENLLSGRNPIREALKSGRDIEKLLVARGELSGSAREIVSMARERRIPVQEVDRARLDAITRNHQGMLAFASAYQYSTVEKMLDLAKQRGEAPFLVLLDGVTDPHNLGAIIRSAECAGAHGVVIPERRSAGLNPACVKAAAGAVEYMKVARVSNLCRAIEEIKERGVWVYAADMDGENVYEADLTGAVAIVIGAEGEGVSQLVLKNCDKTLSIPMKGHINSLNASVAAGIMLFQASRARNG